MQFLFLVLVKFGLTYHSHALVLFECLHRSARNVMGQLRTQRTVLIFGINKYRYDCMRALWGRWRQCLDSYPGANIFLHFLPASE